MKKMSLSKKHKFILLFVLLAVVFGSGYLFGQWRLESEVPNLSSPEDTAVSMSNAQVETDVSRDNAQAEDDAAAAQTEPLVNLNTADYYELLELPGIGDVTARKIVEFREENGGFNELEDLVILDLLSQSQLDALSGLVEVSFP